MYLIKPDTQAPFSVLIVNSNHHQYSFIPRYLLLPNMNSYSQRTSHLSRDHRNAKNRTHKWSDISDCVCQMHISAFLSGSC